MFRKYDFIQLVKSEFPGTMENYFNYGFLENVIDYALDYKNHSKNQFCDFMSGLLPEISFAEVAAFCSSDMLSDSMIGILENQLFA